MSDELPPVIAIDGPSASGKGTVALQVAQHLGFHYLDSGALYRLVAWSAAQYGVALDDGPALAALAQTLSPRFSDEKIYINQKDVSDLLRSEAISAGASQVAALPAVRQALVERQRAFRQPPGLVADGRDMGSVIFPDAALKIYLTASAEARADRRYKQLMTKGMNANMAALLQDIQQRDERDSTRAVSPLQKHGDASLIDTTLMSITDAVAAVLACYAAKTGAKR